MRLPEFGFYLTGVVGTALGIVGVVADGVSIALLIQTNSLFSYLLVCLSAYDILFLVTSVVAYSLPALVESNGKSQLPGEFLRWMENANDFGMNLA